MTRFCWRAETPTAPCDSGSSVFEFAQPTNPPGHIGDGVYRLTGLRFDDRTVGFAAARYGGGLELWSPANGTWHRRDSGPDRSFGGVMTFMTSDRGDPQLAIAIGRGIEVWDLGTGQ